MTRIILLILAALLAWPVTSYAQNSVKICFPTGTQGGSRTTCQDVTLANPLPITGVNVNIGSLSISALNAVSTTVTNTSAVPVFVSNANGFGGNGTVTQGTTPWIVSSPNTFNTNITNNPLNVTQGNGTFRVSQSSSPWLISTPNTVNMNIVGGATLSVSTVTVTNQGAGSQLNVLDTNSAAMLAAIQSSIPAGTNAIGYVTVTNSITNQLAVYTPDVVSPTNTLNLTPINTALSLSTAGQDGTVGFAITGLTGKGAQIQLQGSNNSGTNWFSVNCVDEVTGGLLNLFSTDSNCRVNSAGRTNLRFIVTSASAGAVTSANIASVASAEVGIVSIGAALPAGSNTLGAIQPIPGTTLGWTTALLPTLSNTPSSVKITAGKIAKIYCYNPNSSAAFVQVFNAQPGSVTIGTTSPANSYGIPATSASGYASSMGDTFSTALSLAATTTVSGLTAPSSTLNCNVSYN